MSQDQDRLTHVPVPFRDVLAARRKGSGRSLAADAEVEGYALDSVTLHLGDIVGHVVHLPYAQLPPPFAKHFLEGLPSPVGDALAVGPGEVGGTAHGAQIGPALRRTRMPGL